MVTIRQREIPEPKYGSSGTMIVLTEPLNAFLATPLAASANAGLPLGSLNPALRRK
jgi:hypothetical protein